MLLRTHQRQMLALCDAILGGRHLTDIYASVTPGAGKSWLPVIAAQRLIPAVADKICWVVPRKNLAAQAEDVFVDNALKGILPHGQVIRSAGNEADPSRGLAGYVVTYQALGVDTKGWHAQEFLRHRYILVLDEPHHIGDEAQWPERLAPLVERAALRIFMSGTFERHDRQKIAFVSYRQTDEGEVPDLDGPEGSAKIEYTRAQAISEGAIANLIFRRQNAKDLAWESADGEQKAYGSFEGIIGKDAKAALWTALRRQYADDLLARGIASWCQFRQTNPWAKLLVVAYGQDQAERLHESLAAQGIKAGVAISNDTPAAGRAIDRFKGRKKPALDALVTVQMAYEGMDVPGISHVICLTGIRSKPWLEQCFSRAARIFPGKTHGYIWVPDDPLFRTVYDRIMSEQGSAVYGTRAGDAPVPLPKQDLPGQASGVVPLGASVSGETNSDLKGQVLTTEDTQICADIGQEAGLFGLAPMEINRLILEDAQLLVGLEPHRLAWMRSEYTKRRNQRTSPSTVLRHGPARPSGAVVRQSESEQDLRQKVAKWLNRHAYARHAGTSAEAKNARIFYLRQINTALVQTFGPRDRAPAARLQALWEYVQRVYPA